MIDKVIKKHNLDVDSMKREGTIACLTFLASWIFFGINNAILAYPIALTSSILLKENFKINPLEKTIRLLFLYCFIVILSFLASNHFLLGIIINFFTIFFIAYKLSVAYTPLLYKPFLMLYVFTYFYKVDFQGLPRRLLSIFFGFSLIIIFHLFLNKLSYKSLIKDSINKSLFLLESQVDNLIFKSYNLDLQQSISKELTTICYNLYTTRKRKILTNNLGSIQFKIYIILENLNLDLYNLNKLYSKLNYNSALIKSFLKELKKSINILRLYLNDEISYYEIDKQLYRLNRFHEDLPDQFTFFHDLSISVTNLYLYLADMTTLEEGEGYKSYDLWKNTDKNQFKFRDSLHFGTIKLNFALRISLTLSLVLLLSYLFDFTKMSWLGITIMSIMQPYYEETLNKSKDRLKGNLLAIFLVIIILNLFQSQVVHIIVLVCSLYLTYGFKSYYKLSLFTAISAICMASLSYGVNTLAIFRFFYLALGILITFLANKFLFPYNLDQGLKELSLKLIKYVNILAEDLIKNPSKNEEEIINLTIHIKLMCNKLTLRNIQKKDKDINRLILLTENLTASLSYYTLLKKDLGLVCGINKDELIKLQSKLQYSLKEKVSLIDIINLLDSTVDSLINCPYSRKVIYNPASNGFIY
ncbi:FUSC family protein [Clostridium perfringens]|uniref:FUSC family protein n=1 Tax=Clostridium perfringens TaxID=1502 RepID=UPI0039EC12E0